MNIEVDLQPTAINDAIATAVVASRLGVAIKERIETFLNEDHGYGSPTLSRAMMIAVDAELQKIVTQFINVEYCETIREMVREHLTEDVVSHLVMQAIERLERNR